MGATLNGSLKILALLNEAPSRILSVPELCSKLACQSDALLAKINAINNFDYLISNLGEGRLFLNRQLDFYSEDYIFKAARGRGRISVLECIGSTNTEMLMRPSSLASGDVILAEIQYGGRSRRNTKWVCPVGSQLTMSICAIFEPQVKLAGFSVAVGQVLAETLSSLGVADVKVKWPNDLYLQGKKLCGILVESITNQHGIYVVIGIGLNVHQEGFEELETPHISLAEAKLTFKRNDLAVSLISSLRDFFEQFQHKGFAPYQKNFANWDYLQGRRVAVKTEEQIYQGQACGVDENGALLLQTPLKLEHLSNGHLL